MRRHRHQIVIRSRRQIRNALRRPPMQQPRLHRRQPLPHQPPLDFLQIPRRLPVNHRNVLIIRRHRPNRLRRPHRHRPVVLLRRRVHPRQVHRQPHSRRQIHHIRQDFLRQFRTIHRNDYPLKPRPRPRPPLVRRPDNQHRIGGQMQYLVRNAPHPPPRQPGTPMTGHRDQRPRIRIRLGHDRRRRLPHRRNRIRPQPRPLQLGGFQLNVIPGPPQAMPRHFLRVQPRIQRLRYREMLRLNRAKQSNRQRQPRRQRLGVRQHLLRQLRAVQRRQNFRVHHIIQSDRFRSARYQSSAGAGSSPSPRRPGRTPPSSESSTAAVSDSATSP